MKTNHSLGVDVATALDAVETALAARRVAQQSLAAQEDALRNAVARLTESVAAVNVAIVSLGLPEPAEAPPGVQSQPRAITIREQP